MCITYLKRMVHFYAIYCDHKTHDLCSKPSHAIHLLAPDYQFHLLLDSLPRCDASPTLPSEHLSMHNQLIVNLKVGISTSCVLPFVTEPTGEKGVAVISAKNHKRQRRKRQSVTAKREKSQTPKVLTAILTLPNLTSLSLT